MKRIFTIAILLLFVVQSTSSVWILLSFYAKQDFISRVLCINRFEEMPECKGKCYLSKQLNQSDENQSKLPTIKQPSEELFFHLPMLATYALQVYDQVKQPLNYHENLHPSSFFDDVFHPPC